MSETIKTDNWFDTKYPDPVSGSIKITIEYVCGTGKDTEQVTHQITFVKFSVKIFLL